MTEELICTGCHSCLIGEYYQVPWNSSQYYHKKCFKERYNLQGYEDRVIKQYAHSIIKTNITEGVN